MEVLPLLIIAVVVAPVVAHHLQGEIVMLIGCYGVIRMMALI